MQLQSLANEDDLDYYQRARITARITELRLELAEQGVVAGVRLALERLRDFDRFHATVRDIDAALVRFCEGVDHLIYDATYLPSEYESLRKGWGHSTWYAAIGTARDARVRNLVLILTHFEHVFYAGGE